jgi:hypothetical protein
VAIHDTAAWKSFEDCTSLESFLHVYKIAGRTTAYQLMAIVRRFPRAQAMKQGMEFVYGMVRYCTLLDELRNIGSGRMIFQDLDVEKLTVREVEAINRRLRAALEGEVEVEPPKPPKPPPRPPKTPYARSLEKHFRKLGAKRATVWSYTKGDEPWLRIKVPQAQWELIGTG